MTASGTPSVIRTRGLEKTYGEHVAVRSLDLDIHAGEVFGLLGPNGAGKTTTILMLLGLTERTGGTAEVLGLDPARYPLQVKRHVGYLPDNVGFYGSMTGRENLRYTARLNGIARDAADETITTLLAQVGLADSGDARVDTYSRGMRQRLGLADALVKGPSILILDEPTTAIDPTGVVETLEMVRQLAHEQGVAILLSSHLLHQVQQVCDRIAIFVAGEVVAMGTVADLARRQTVGATERIEVGAHGEAASIRDVLSATPGVTGVEAHERDSRLWMVAGEIGVAERVARALLDAGHAPWHLRDEGMGLDEIYQRYFTSTAVAPSRRARSTTTDEPVPAAPVARSTAPRRRMPASSARQRRGIHRSERRTERPPEERDDA